MTSVNKPKIIVIVGPNASGKSDLAIKLAKKINGEIISADSRQVYRGMDIGTGKVKKDKSSEGWPDWGPHQHGGLLSTDGVRKDRTPKLIGKQLFYSEGIRHHLIDVVSPKTEFTASHFKKLGEKAIKEISAKGKIPIICGGTGFYIDTLLERIQIPEIKPNKKLRAQFDKLTAEHLFKMLRKLDPERAKTIDAKNKRRLIRALEIIIATGKPIPKLETNHKYDILWLGVKWPKEILEKRIKIRLEKRLKQGMVKEVKNLIKSGISHKRLYDFGLEYRWISEYLQNKISYQEMKNGLLSAIIQYSKRQMTWFKRNKEINWIKNQIEANTLVKKFYS